MKDNEGELKRAEMIKWLKRYKPEVIVGHDSRLKEWAEAAGYRVPEDIGIALLAVDDDVLDWAGIHSRRRESGATAIEWLVSLMRNHQYGVPTTPLNILIRGTWQTGKTLIAKKAKS
jgi:LacI family transcriptional regulator